MGEIDPYAMIEDLPASLLAEWRAFYECDPWGEQRADSRVAVLSALTANMNRGKGQKAYEIRDFLLYPPPKPETTGDDAQTLMAKLGHLVKKAKT